MRYIEQLLRHETKRPFFVLLLPTDRYKQRNDLIINIIK